MNAPSRSRLPKLSAILAFETAARTGSLARAADSLALTAAAVSQQIRQLEQHLGITLFIRAKSGVTLTEQGGIIWPTYSRRLKRCAWRSSMSIANGAKRH